MFENISLKMSKYIVYSSEPLAELFFLGRRKRLGGRVMDAKAQAIGSYLKKVAAGAPVPSVEQSRINSLTGRDLFDEPCPKLVRKEDMSIGGAEGELKARLYSDQPKGERALPVLLYFHGGGFMQGDLDTHDGICGKLAKWGKCIVVAVDYRLSPENKFPAGINDAIAAFKSACENAASWGGDATRIGVGGDSAGGNFSSIICQQQAITGDTIPYLQVLIYPGLDHTLSTKSAVELRDAYIISEPRLNYFLDKYIGPDADDADLRLSPLSNKALADQPKSYIISAGFDPLRDEAAQYAQQLKQCGVAVEYKEYSGQIHAFVNFCKIIPQGNMCIRGIADWLKLNW